MKPANRVEFQKWRESSSNHRLPALAFWACLILLSVGCGGPDSAELAHCGDGVVAATEECDNGEKNSDEIADACRTTCKLPHPGDGVKDSGEECDDGNQVNTDDCRNNGSLAVCGDGVVREGVEECDDGNIQDGDGCSSQCQITSADTMAPRVAAFSISPTTISAGASLTASYSVNDDRALASIVLRRAPYQSSTCSDTVETGCVWTKVAMDNLGGASKNGTLDDSPPVGTFFYGLQVTDGVGNVGHSAHSVKIAVNQETHGTANPNASARAKALLHYLYSLSSRTDQKVISGQFVGSTSAIYRFDSKTLEDVHTKTGEWPGMIGLDYCDYGDPNGTTPSFTPPRYDLANPTLIDYWKKGGLVTISAHLSNPQTGLSCNSYKIDIPSLLKEGGSGHAIYMKWLDIIADGLKELQDEGVVVIWRPFHERFWWGNNSEHYPKLWRHMFDYFTHTKKLNNLLWLYAAEGRRMPQPKEKYPGDAYVDIVAFDFYRYDLYPLPNDDVANEIYEFMMSTGKPFFMGEVGKDNGSEEGTWDSVDVIRSIKANFPKTAAFQVWGGRWSLAHNLNAKQLLSDSWIINRDDLSF